MVNGSYVYSKRHWYRIPLSKAVSITYCTPREWNSHTQLLQCRLMDENLSLLNCTGCLMAVCMYLIYIYDYAGQRQISEPDLVILTCTPFNTAITCITFIINTWWINNACKYVVDSSHSSKVSMVLSDLIVCVSIYVLVICATVNSNKIYTSCVCGKSCVIDKYCTMTDSKNYSYVVMASIYVWEME